MNAPILESRKGNGLLIGLASGILVSAIAVAVGPSATAVLPEVLSFIGLLTGAHQAAQTVQDVSKANKQAQESPK